MSTTALEGKVVVFQGFPPNLNNVHSNQNSQCKGYIFQLIFYPKLIKKTHAQIKI